MIKTVPVQNSELVKWTTNNYKPATQSGKKTGEEVGVGLGLGTVAEGTSLRAAQ